MFDMVCEPAREIAAGFRILGCRMSMYVNIYDEHVSLPNCAAIETERSARVTYHNEAGKKFTVIVRQKPNPIGFRASLPGDRRR